jgi:hypothetical protein
MKFEIMVKAVIEVSGADMVRVNGDIMELMTPDMKALSAVKITGIRMPDGEIVEMDEDVTKDLKSVFKKAGSK